MADVDGRPVRLVIPAEARHLRLQHGLLRHQRIAVRLGEGRIERGEHVALAHDVAGPHAQLANDGGGERLHDDGGGFRRQPAGRRDDRVDPHDAGDDDDADEERGDGAVRRRKP